MNTTAQTTLEILHDMAGEATTPYERELYLAVAGVLSSEIAGGEAERGRMKKSYEIHSCLDHCEAHEDTPLIVVYNRMKDHAEALEAINAELLAVNAELNDSLGRCTNSDDANFARWQTVLTVNAELLAALEQLVDADKGCFLDNDMFLKAEVAIAHAKKASQPQAFSLSR